MKAARIILLLLVWHTGFSQWTENFEDGNFDVNPSWVGDTADFKIENYVLKLSAPSVSGSAYLSTTSRNIDDATWQFSVKLDFNPSSSNYTKIYLVASSNVLTDVLKGYYVKIGGSSDEVSLFRQDGVSDEEIIDGTDGRLSISEVNVQVLVSRSAEGHWQLSSKLEAEVDWYTEGNTQDISYVQSSYFGIQCIYTATRSTKFSFDDIIVTGAAYVDLSAPLVDTVYTSGSNNVVVEFSEAIESSSASTTANYLLNNLSQPNSVVSSNNSVELEFDSPLKVINDLSITGVADLSQNIMSDTLVQFIYIDPLPVAFGDIIINEIMADPSPSENLPEIEYVEIHNVSRKAINMTEWSFRDKTSGAEMANIIILPDSFLIFCKKADVDLMRPFGNVIGLSPWPSLNNSGDSLSLVNELEELIDAVVYDDDWYQDDEKQDGGWSLERINPDHPCSGYLNWQASMDMFGGTPGSENSVLSNEDYTPPTILNFSVEPDKLTVTFNEPINDTLGNISITPANAVLQTKVNYNQLHILTSESFEPEVINEVIFSLVADCFNNGTNSLSISFIPDFEPPEIDTVYSEYPNTLEIYFNENVQTPAIGNFQINILGSPPSLEHDPVNQTHVTLFYGNGLSYAEKYTIIINDVGDENNNMTAQSQYLFTYRPLDYPQFAQVLITEIMADPEPTVSLPEYEYIELTNRTSKRLLLKGLILADAKDKVTIPTGIIEPYERVILTKTSATDYFSAYAKTLGIPNWPTLNNTGDQIMILDTGFQVIHHISYTNDWYDNDEKKAGGWSLELIDETSFCSGDRVWSASISNLGGTPGVINSIQSTLPDLIVPHIAEAFAATADSILIRFDESLTNKLPAISIPTLSILEYDFTNFKRDEILLNVEPLQPRIKYEFIVSKILDCVGNINDEEKVAVILPEAAEQGEVIVSEILFNPRGEAVDFIEIYNNSAKYISLFNWQISNGVSSVNVDAAEVLHPYSFRVFTPQPETLSTEYPNARSENIYLQAIPTMPNEQGNVVLHDWQHQLFDSIHYDEEWHFPFLSSVDGISLERIGFDQPANLYSNWASAAATENYATPGYKNSQAAGTNNGALSIVPKVIVPDANGRDDFTTIKLNLSGSMVSIIIYNLQGQSIKHLANNTLVGNSSIFTWDGTDNTGAVVSLGHYIVVANIISTGGTTQTFRGKVVVGTGF